MTSIVRGLVPVAAFLVLYLIVILTFYSLNTAFLSASNISEILRGMSASGIAAMGLTFVIITRHFDMAFPWVASLAAMTMGFLISLGFDVPTSIGGGLIVALLWGVVNGVAVAFFRLPDIITTIGTGSIAFGLGYLYSNGVSIFDNFLTSGILVLNDGSVLGVRLPIALMILIFALGWIVLDLTRFGRAFYAVGENRRSAYLSGIPVRTYVFAAFCIASVLASFGAIIASASGGQADVRTGANFLMPAYASVFLGNALFRRPSAGATFLGMLLITTMLNGFTVLSVPYYYGDAIESLVLILALLCSQKQIRDGIGGLVAKRRRVKVEVAG